MNRRLVSKVALIFSTIVTSVLFIVSLQLAHSRSYSIPVEEELCPTVEENPKLYGKLPKEWLYRETTEAEILQKHPELKQGGKWKPSNCKARSKVAIIIPYRDRKSHLTRFLNYLIPILQRQKLDFRFIVTEQLGDDLFNKGRIMNSAFKYADALGVDCVVFHDVDMFPEDDRTPYSCPREPFHLGAFVDSLLYKPPYEALVGGALSMPMEVFKNVNGYSNLYWGWGGEDDDIGYRILSRKYKIGRPNPKTARFTMMTHVQRQRTVPTLIRKMVRSATSRMLTDGLSQTLWDLEGVEIGPLYHHLFINVGPSPNVWKPKG